MYIFILSDLFLKKHLTNIGTFFNPHYKFIRCISTHLHVSKLSFKITLGLFFWQVEKLTQRFNSWYTC